MLPGERATVVSIFIYIHPPRPSISHSKFPDNHLGFPEHMVPTYDCRRDAEPAHPSCGIDETNPVLRNLHNSLRHSSSKPWKTALSALSASELALKPFSRPSSLRTPFLCEWVALAPLDSTLGIDRTQATHPRAIHRQQSPKGL